MINRAVRLKRLVRLFRSTACTRNLAARKQANSLRKKENSQFMAPFYPIAAAMAREGGGRRRSSSLTGPVRVVSPTLVKSGSHLQRGPSGKTGYSLQIAI